MKKRNKNILLGMLTIILVWITIVEINNLLDGGLHDTRIGANNSNIFSNIFGTEVELDGSSIDLDPDLSPSYSQEFVWYAFLTPVIFPTVIIVALFVGTFAVLKRKNIPSRQYLVLILAGILLFFTLPNFVSSLAFIPYLISHPEQIRPYIFEQILFRMWWQIVILTIVGILLYRSSVIRNLIKK